MRVNALDHVNIFTDDMAGSARFYNELLDLQVRDGPAPLRPEHVQWVYDGQDRPIIHLNTYGAPQAFRRDCAPGLTGPIHHVALNCSGKADVIGRLQMRGAEFSVNEIASIGLTQVFTHDPNGVSAGVQFLRRLSARLLHRHRLGEIARLVDVGALLHGDVVGHQLDRRGEHERRDQRVAGRPHDHLIPFGACGRPLRR